MLCRCDGIGRRSGLKIHRWRQRTGSSPVTGTNSAPFSWITGRSKYLSGCSAAGSAPALGAGCRRFESCHSDQTLYRSNVVFGRYFAVYRAEILGFTPQKREGSRPPACYYFTVFRFKPELSPDGFPTEARCRCFRGRQQGGPPTRQPGHRGSAWCTGRVPAVPAGKGERAFR